MKRFRSIFNFLLIFFLISSTFCNITCAFFEIHYKKENQASSSCHYSIVQNQKNQFIQNRLITDCDFLHKQLENYSLLNLFIFFRLLYFNYRIKIFPQQINLTKSHRVYFTYLYILFRVLRI